MLETVMLPYTKFSFSASQEHNILKPPWPYLPNGRPPAHLWAVVSPPPMLPWVDFQGCLNGLPHMLLLSCWILSEYKITLFFIASDEKKSKISPYQSKVHVVQEMF